jgi:hypothetical protein
MTSHGRGVRPRTVRGPWDTGYRRQAKYTNKQHKGLALSRLTLTWDRCIEESTHDEPSRAAKGSVDIVLPA